MKSICAIHLFKFQLSCVSAAVRYFNIFEKFKFRCLLLPWFDFLNVKGGCVKSSKEDCFVPISYLTWSYSRIDNKEDKAFEVPGIAQMLLILFVLGIVFHFMLFLLERKIIRQLQGRMNKTSTSSFRSDPDDDDVAAESQRVDELVKTGIFKTFSFTRQN